MSSSITTDLGGVNGFTTRGIWAYRFCPGDDDKDDNEDEDTDLGSVPAGMATGEEDLRPKLKRRGRGGGVGVCGNGNSRFGFGSMFTSKSYAKKIKLNPYLY